MQRGRLDKEKEKQKLLKQKSEILQRLKIANTKLTNEKFLSKAPKHIVDEERYRARELSDKLDKVEDHLKRLEDMII